MKTKYADTGQIGFYDNTKVMLMLISGILLTGIAVLWQTHTRTVQTVAIADTKNQGYDPILLPITAGEVEDGLARNSHDATAEYQLLLRAGYHHQEKAAYETMKELSEKHPDNAIVLAGYFLATKMGEGGACTVIYNGAYQALPIDRWADDDAQAALQRAYKLSPKLWMTYAVGGADQFYGPTISNKVTSTEQGIVLLQKAETLAPNVPYVRWLMANVYTGEPVSRQKYRLAAGECEKTLSLDPKVSDAAFTLFQIYSIFAPDPTKERIWKRRYLALVPPNTKINPAAKRWLDKYP